MTIIRDADTGDSLGLLWESCRCEDCSLFPAKFFTCTIDGELTSESTNKRQALNELYVEILKNQKGADNG